MLLVMQPPAPPAGKYHMRLIARLEIAGNFNSPAYRWVLQVEGSEFHGNQISKVTGRELKDGESLAKLVCSFYGKPIEVGASIDIDELLGKLYLVSVITTKSGASSIESITPAECT